MATLIHSPQTPPIPSTAVEDTRDYQTLAQVQTQIINSQNGAGHRVLGGTANDVLIVTAGGGISSTSSPSITGTLQVADGTATAPSLAFASQTTLGFWKVASNQIGIAFSTADKYLFYNAGFVLPSTAQLAWTSIRDASSGSIDLSLNRVAAGQLLISDSGGTNFKAIQAAFFNTPASSVLSISSNTIAPTGGVHHVGAGLIKTITVPALLTPTSTIQIIPDAAYTYDATGNVVVPAGGGTATVNKLMTFTWDGSKWTPSY